jgi:hypothetical protein
VPRRRPSINSCVRSVSFPSTIVRVQSIALRVPWNLRVSIMRSTPSAVPTPVVASARFGAEAPWLALVSWAHLRNFPNWPCSRIFSLERGRAGTFYGVTKLYRKDPQPLREDLPKIFELLGAKKINPLIQTTFPLLEARQAIELLASGSVEVKIVLTNG